MGESDIVFECVQRLLRCQPGRFRLLNWLRGRRYLITILKAIPEILIVVAHSRRDSRVAEQLRLALEKDWLEAPPPCRKNYEDLLLDMPSVVVVQLRRNNVCGCLGHRHLLVKEPIFAEPHEVYAERGVGEIDLAYQRVAAWEPWPLMNTALDAKFLAGSRRDDFHLRQFRLRLLSVLLHETNHLVRPREPETSVRARSLNFYREALAAYFETAVDTLSLTLDRSFSRLG